MIIIRSKITKVREIVSALLTNQSVVTYLSKSTAIQIQHCVKDCKRDCLVFYSLGDDLFDTIFLSKVHDVSHIADDPKKK